MPEREETASAPLASTAVERPVPISPIRNPVRVQVRGPARSSAVRRLPARRRRAGKTVLRRNYKQQALLGAPATELLRNPQSAIDNPQSAVRGHGPRRSLHTLMVHPAPAPIRKSRRICRFLSPGAQLTRGQMVTRGERRRRRDISFWHKHFRTRRRSPAPLRSPIRNRHSAIRNRGHGPRCAPLTHMDISTPVSYKENARI